MDAKKTAVMTRGVILSDCDTTVRTYLFTFQLPLETLPPRLYQTANSGDMVTWIRLFQRLASGFIRRALGLNTVSCAG